MLKRIGCVIVAVATALLLVSNAGAQDELCLGDNLVVNGGFDTDADGWVTAGWSWSKADGNPGGCAKNTGTAYLNQNITIEHDGEYLFSYDFNQTGLGIDWFVRAGPFGDGLVKETPPAWGDRRHGSSNAWTFGVWHTIKGNAIQRGRWTYGDGLPTFIAGGTTFNLMFLWTHPAYSGSLRIDNVSIREVLLHKFNCSRINGHNGKTPLQS